MVGPDVFFFDFPEMRPEIKSRKIEQLLLFDGKTSIKRSNVCQIHLNCKLMNVMETFIRLLSVSKEARRKE